MSTANTPATPQWSSRLGFILASAGSAIGLGAIWKFPFWAGANGGAAFIIPFIVFTLTVGLVLVAAEIALGRRGRGSAVSAMRRVGGRAWGLMGAFSVLTAFLILSYYAVVGGWCAAYLAAAVTGGVVSNDPAALRAQFADLVSTDWKNLYWFAVFLLLTAATVALGVERGIERLAKYLMPTLFVLMVVLIVRGLMLPGAWAGVEYLFDFRWESVTAASIRDAMGFTFFSLSLGAGILVTYGTYVPKSTSIPKASFWVAVLSIEAALLSGLMTMPAAFAFGLSPDAGPGLVFITVPMIFERIPAGGLFAVLFYVCLLVAALTSSVSLLEVVVAFLKNEWHFSRRAATVTSGAALFVLGSASALSFGSWSSFTLFGRSIFDCLDFLCSNVMMPAGGLTVALLMGWKVWETTCAELSTPPGPGPAALETARVLLAYLSPILILATVYQGVFF